MPSPDVLGRNGTYLVFRKLHTEVAAFRRYVRARATDKADEELLAAKFVGRWPSGAPLDLAPDRDDPDPVGQALDQLWADALDKEIHLWTRRLSHPLLQIIFNLPSVVLIAYVGWLTASGFFRGIFCQFIGKWLRERFDDARQFRFLAAEFR